MYILERATPENGAFGALKAQWSEQLLAYDENPAEFAVPYLDHSERIAGERPEPANYGIFLLKDEQGAYHGLMHVNVASLPHTVGKTLRILWILYGPKYEFEDVTEGDLATLVSSLLQGAIDICTNVMVANHVKIRLESSAERTFAHGVATALCNKTANGSLVEVRGSWLHMDGVCAP